MKATAIMLLITATGVLLMLLFDQKVMLLVASFFFGAAYAVGAASIPALLRHLFGAKRYGAVYSKITPISSVGYSLFLTFAGYAYDFAGSYRPVFITGIVFALISVVIIAVLSSLRAKQPNMQ